MDHLERVLRKAEAEKFITVEETLHLLDLSDADLLRLFETARKLRNKYFGNRVFLYGFIYFSTWCRNNCAFCFYRTANPSGQRYRKSVAEIAAIAKGIAGSGVHLIDLTMGEDPLFHYNKGGATALAALVGEVKATSGLPVMISPGLASQDLLETLVGAGADWYACYQETHNRDLFSRLRLNQSYDQRLSSKKQAQQIGLLVEEGIMIGVGETAADIATSVEVMRELKAHQVRVMGFVPQEGSAMADWPPVGRQRELAAIAVLRLHFPDRLIPASLDVDGLAGLKRRLLAGANVITSLIPPGSGLSGVARNKLDIEEGLRSTREVAPILAELNLQIAPLGEYRNWVEKEKAALRASPGAFTGPARPS